MKIDCLKIESLARGLFLWLFVVLTATAVAAVILGYWQHVLTAVGCASIAYSIARHW